MNYKLIFVILCVSFIPVIMSGMNMETPKDSLPEGVERDILLDDVDVIGYLRPQSRKETPASVAILTSADIARQPVTSMVQVMNTISGVRMEERSPGSYRLSIRGSLVRSPYGVRNVKVYYNGFALTDAGGNTYLNALNINDIAGIEVLKGPDGSLFGANSGGVVFLKSNTDDISNIRLNVYGGSRGLFGEAVALSKNTGGHYLSLKQSYQRADGYRTNTHNRRLFVQASDNWQYATNGVLGIYAFYSDIDYGTPGGLTKQQYDENPEQSRPATATMPGSAEQKTGVKSKMYFGGINNKLALAPFLTHNISVWAHHADYSNSAITNCETRDETNMGLRTYFSFADGRLRSKAWNLTADVGFEGQRLISKIHNYDNNAGEKGDIQAYSDIINYQYFGFLRGKIKWRDRLLIQAAVSLNYNGYHFRDTTNIKNKFDPVLMPNFALSYMICEPLTVRLTFSKGYSTPTTAEVRPTDNKIYADLQAEHGWNTEAGLRLKLFRGRLALDASCFHYLLKDGIISQISETGDTYFVNSGKIKQLGVENTGSWIVLPFSTNRLFFKRIQLNSSYTWSLFNYDSYVINDEDDSGNRVAGVPRNIVVNSFQFDLPVSLYFFIQHNHTSRIPLNDANNMYADSYNLLYMKAGYQYTGRKGRTWDIYAAVDNLLDEKYSLGNDINAFGGRYFNAAPGINFHVGVRWSLN